MIEIVYNMFEGEEFSPSLFFRFFNILVKHRVLDASILLDLQIVQIL